MLDRLTSMAVFVKTVDAGSFAVAAAQLGMSSQMAGKHVTMLEESLNARLLNRSTRRQSLTDIGRVFYERCKAVLAEVEHANAVVEDLTTAPRGRLRVNAPVTFGNFGLMPHVLAYMRQYPGVEVELLLNDRYVDLIEEGFDVVFRLGPLADSTLVGRSLAPYRLIACAAPDYLAAHGNPADPGALEKHQCVGFLYSSRPTASEWRFTREGEVHHARLRARLHVNDMKALLMAALDGQGIILAPEILVGPELAAGRLVRVMPDYEAPSRELNILYAADRRATPKLRSFIEFILGRLGEGAAPLA